MATNTSPHINEEPEDIFAIPTQQKDEEMMSVGPSRIVNGETRKGGSEMTAAAALTILVRNPDSSPVDVDETEIIQDEEEEEEKEFEIPQRLTKSGRKRAVPFTLKLMEVLSRKEYADIIAWTPSGKAFNVINPKEFTAGILPTHFKSAKYSSFTRKLHRWGFIRHYRGEEAGAFHHKYFQKDRLELVEQMTCFKEGDKPDAPSKREEKMESLASRPTPMATMEAHPSLIADVQAPLPSRFLSSMSGWSGNPSIQQSGLMNGSSDLNAAIEMEVSRRLKERVSAAAMSREALAMMQHQMKSPSSSYIDQRYLSLLQQGGVPSRLIGNNLIASYKKELAMTQHFNSTAANFAAMNVSSDQRQRLNNLPANIKIAKTA